MNENRFAGNLHGAVPRDWELVRGTVGDLVILMEHPEIGPV